MSGRNAKKATKRAKVALRLKVGAEFSTRANDQPRVGQDLVIRSVVPIGASEGRDKNGGYTKKMQKEFKAADESLRRQMMMDKTIDCIKNQGELLPVVKKAVDADGNIDYDNTLIWQGPEDPNDPIVLETRPKADGTERKNKGTEIRPWWNLDLWVITPDENKQPCIKQIQLGGEAVSTINMGSIPWFKPCEIRVTEQWRNTLSSTRVEDFIREIEDEEAITDFLGQSEFGEGDLKLMIAGNLAEEATNKELEEEVRELFKAQEPMLNPNGEAVYTAPKKIQNPDPTWESIYLMDAHFKTKNTERSQWCTVFDKAGSILSTEPMRCWFYAKHVQDQLYDTEGGAYGLLFYRPTKKKNLEGKLEDTFDLFGVLVYRYDKAAPAEEQP